MRRWGDNERLQTEERKGSKRAKKKLHLPALCYVRFRVYHGQGAIA
jgi:hypothetical protein